MKPRRKFKPGPRPVPGRMNKTEEAFARWLDAETQAGKIIEHHFEPIKLRLAKRLHYTPDFLAMTKDGVLIAYEVKGFWRDDARVKIKAAAAKFWWLKFIAVQLKRKAWQFEEIEGE